MRMGTFLLGGIAGALAISYINRNSGMMMANMANAGQSVGNMVSQAKSKLSNANVNMGMSTGNNVHQSDSQSSDPADMSRVKEILNKDPNLKTKVDEILADNEETTSASRMQ